MSAIRPFLALLVLLAVGCSRGGEPGAPPRAGVNVAEVVQKKVREWDDFTGRLEAPERVEIRPRVSGYLAEVAFEEGALVKAGDLLFRIDDREYRAAVSRADPAVVSSSEAIATVGQFAREMLPNGMSFEWTGLTYQQVGQGNAGLLVFPLCVLLVLMVLAALYESWSLPFSVILIVPMCLLFALGGVWITGGDNNVFVQIGLVVLMGLACKNAILIVEFARELEGQGRTPVQAAIEASRLRLRPIVMTSFAFIAGVVPLVLASGAGAEVRNVMGVTVLAGMLGVTLFGLYLTPVFYSAIRRRTLRGATADEPPSTSSTPGIHAERDRMPPHGHHS
jgi:pyruvate/2-oxoglutarate dehydrogenase complex dihydrolipoamide acyltransferase (E2) component